MDPANEKADAQFHEGAVLTAAEKFPNVSERKVLLKMDLCIIPTVSLLYLMAFLDRGNIGNAKIEGLSEDLGLSANQYNMALTVFFFTYAVFEVPSNIILKRTRPKLYIPAIMLLWGVVMTLMGIVQNYGGLVATRVLLGVFEAGLHPGVAFYLTTFYTRGEMQFRQALFCCSASVAGAFSGILAFAIAKLDGKANLAGWRWIFIIEGIATVVIAFASFFMVQDSPETSVFLTPEEREFAAYRLKYDNNSDIHNEASHNREENKEFSWHFTKQALTDPQVYLHAVLYWGVVCPIYGISLFLPSIVKTMGYQNSEAQLMTVPIYVIAAVCSIAQALVADKVGYRSPVVFFNFMLSIIGYVVSITVDVNQNPAGTYVGMVFAAIGCYTAFPTLVTWHSNNLAGHSKRAVGMAMQIGIGNLGGAMAANFYRAKDAPRYRLGHGLELMFTGLAFLAGLAVLFYYWRQNKKREKDIQAGKYESWTLEQLDALGDRNPYFRYRL